MCNCQGVLLSAHLCQSSMPLTVHTKWAYTTLEMPLLGYVQHLSEIRIWILREEGCVPLLFVTAFFVIVQINSCVLFGGIYAA